MSEPALKAGIWVSAQIRLCDTMSMPAMVRRRGDADAGSILLRIDRLDGHSMVLSQIRDAMGARNWLRATGPHFVPDADAEAYISRRIQADPDIWVLEIEDRHGRYEPDAPVVS